jgi:hypothetical protein
MKMSFRRKADWTGVPKTFIFIKNLSELPARAKSRGQCSEFLSITEVQVYQYATTEELLIQFGYLLISRME